MDYFCNFCIRAHGHLGQNLARLLSARTGGHERGPGRRFPLTCPRLLCYDVRTMVNLPHSVWKPEEGGPECAAGGSGHTPPCLKCRYCGEFLRPEEYLNQCPKRKFRSLEVEV